ncbi:ROK family transcriptional regulator [Glutamicibacter halophytocola]|uniref:ROK family protein n=1 Tax=Glutamicibacter halophytocola TaxID=1933880 RepID=A0A5B8IS16_9MICC|nr:ROK family transcriptional regulator [Glutamicibacter halophytocola]QDY67138.1 ROK family protein [Glutamicibacter halophytocola]UUX59314.1 ROK family protein [Glutamicibacter halophytocola]
MRQPAPAARAATSSAPGTVGDVRKANLSRVLSVIAAAGDDQRLSRADIAQVSQLTKASVSSLVADLLAAGLVIEIGVHRDGERGRPSVGLVLNPARCVMGMEINVDYIAAGLVDLNGKLLAHEILPRTNHRSTASEVLGALGELSQGLQGAARAQGLMILGGGLAVPGLVNEEQFTVLQAPNLGWEGQELDVAALLPEPKTRFRLFNEANASALAQQHLMDAQDRDFLFVSGEVGIGGGLIIDGELFVGPQGHAGELGHVVIAPDGKACSCGGRGCLETVAGQEAILAAANLGSAADRISRQERMSQLCQALETGAEPAVGAVAGAGKSLGIAVASAMRLYSVSTVVFGGHFAALEQWLRPAMEAGLQAHAPSIAGQARLLCSPLGQTSALAGAARSVVGDLLEAPHLLVD